MSVWMPRHETKYPMKCHYSTQRIFKKRNQIIGSINGMPNAIPTFVYGPRSKSKHKSEIIMSTKYKSFERTHFR